VEIAALVAAVLAYGRVETIIKNVNDLFNRMDDAPVNFVRNSTFREKCTRFKGFKHRFNNGYDLAAVLHAAGKVICRFGSLGSHFAHGIAEKDLTIMNALDRFTLSLKNHARRCAPDRAKEIDFLLSSPASGSACKRMNMYLRWMIRPRDGIDLGIWTILSPSRLIMPIDTHVARIARAIGLTGRNTADWVMAEEVTGRLRDIDPADPVRFDFSLCRSGMDEFRRGAA
jgi:uncharacterized protein (TIGR02757 family)